MEGNREARQRARKWVRRGAVGLVLALSGALLAGCAGLAGLGVEGGVHETSVIPPPPEMAVQLRTWLDKDGTPRNEQLNEKLKDPSRHAHFEVLQTTWRDKNGEEHKGTVAALVTDPPPPHDTGVPARDAWVVVMWRYAGSYSDGCVHGVVVRTDAAGNFHAHGWIDPLNFGPEFYPWRRYQRLVVYKPGYAIADTGAGADIRISADKQPFIMLHPMTGGLGTRLDDLHNYLENPTLNCSTSSLFSPPSPQMAPFLLAIADEAASLATTRAERDGIEAMRTQIKFKTGLIKVDDRPPPIEPVSMTAKPAMVAPAQPAQMAPARMAPASSSAAATPAVMAPVQAAPVKQAR